MASLRVLVAFNIVLMAQFASLIASVSFAVAFSLSDLSDWMFVLCAILLMIYCTPLGTHDITTGDTIGLFSDHENERVGKLRNNLVKQSPPCWANTSFNPEQVQVGWAWTILEPEREACNLLGYNVNKYWKSTTSSSEKTSNNTMWRVHDKKGMHMILLPLILQTILQVILQWSS